MLSSSSRTWGSSGPHAPLARLNIRNAWTDITLSTPALWAAIRVVLPRYEGYRKLFETWPQRARNRPLFLSLSGTSAEGVAAIVWRHGQQMKRLELCYDSGGAGDNDETDCDEDIDLLRCSSPGPLPLLEELTIRRSGHRGDELGYRGSRF
ncbi:hypothetical protein B0H11DRAFT_2034412 [Mycena galericulata]|nr:hypothetical protein B0H11DRAFT_2034412 [Mycena galericulata]